MALSVYLFNATVCVAIYYTKSLLPDSPDTATTQFLA